MSEMWTNRETARKEELLDARLRTNAKVVLRCAECILARSAADDNSRCFTGTEIERCTGLSEMVVTHTLKKPLAAGYLDKTEAPSNFLTSSKRPMLYSPQSNGGRDFFVPQHQRGCDRTAISNTLESLTRTQRDVLERAGQHLQLPIPITTSEITESADMDRAVVRKVFTTFIRCGVLAITSSVKHGNARHGLEYELTDYGKELVSGLEQQTGVDVLKGELSDATLRSIQNNYPPEQHDRIMNYTAMLIGVDALKHRMPDQLPGNGAVLGFDSRVQAAIGKNGCLAIAHWLALDPLIYGQRFHPAAVRRALAVPTDANFGSHVREHYYEPMLDMLKVDRTASVNN